MKTQYIVYKIVVDGIIRYIGRTNNLNRRYDEHKKLIAKGKSKPLYDYIRSDECIDKQFTMEIISTYSSLVESKRMECYLILQDYFTTKQLIQKPPSISDR